MTQDETATVCLILWKDPGTSSLGALNTRAFTKQQSDALSVNESETYGLHFLEKIDHFKNEGAKCLGNCIMGFAKARKDVNYFRYSLRAK